LLGFGSFVPKKNPLEGNKIEKSRNISGFEMVEDCYRKNWSGELKNWAACSHP
jgi:hypothetical protein